MDGAPLHAGSVGPEPPLALCLGLVVRTEHVVHPMPGVLDDVDGVDAVPMLLAQEDDVVR